MTEIRYIKVTGDIAKGEYEDVTLEIEAIQPSVPVEPTIETLKVVADWNQYRRENPKWKANLYGADLCEADLHGADLREADLRGADLREADLRGADLYGADLRGADLREADLSGADLKQLKNALRAIGVNV